MELLEGADARVINKLNGRTLIFRSSNGMDKNFRDFWDMITWNHALQARYPNLIILTDLAHVQYVSIATYERVFSVQNVIKTKVKK